MSRFRTIQNAQRTLTAGRVNGRTKLSIRRVRVGGMLDIMIEERVPKDLHRMNRMCDDGISHVPYNLTWKEEEENMGRVRMTAMMTTHERRSKNDNWISRGAHG
jgi:hypothetical protein